MKQFAYLLSFLLLLTACTKNPPKEFTEVRDSLHIYPDYSGITIPCNLAPLHFEIMEKADDYRIVLSVDGQQKAVFDQNSIRMGVKEWHRWIQTGKTSELVFDMYLKKKEKWFHFPAVRDTVVPDPIDEYLTFRLIEPSYITYNDLSIRQRNLTNFEESIVYTNEALNDKENVQCINCHSFQNYNAGRMQFHVRGDNGGTVICMDKQLKKISMKTGNLMSTGVYPAWHPVEKLIAYSINSTGQFFHKRNTEKVEVQDDASGLILLDPVKEEVSVICNDTNRMATFPAWSPDGKTLYYAVAGYLPQGKCSCKGEALINGYANVHYSIACRSFDVKTRTFGKEELIWNAAAINKSATLPRISPDGRYLLFTEGDYGTFHIWHRSSDIHLLDLKTRRERKLEFVNSPDAESYHSWSSSGRWMVISSRRDDGSYTRPYFAWFDRQGRAHKPFLLPHDDPEYTFNLMKSYNIPEFVKEPVSIPVQDFAKVIQTQAKTARLISQIHRNPQART